MITSRKGWPSNSIGLRTINAGRITKVSEGATLSVYASCKDSYWFIVARIENRDSVGGAQTRCGLECSNTFAQGAIVYFPPGTYRICSPVV